MVKGTTQYGSYDSLLDQHMEGRLLSVEELWMKEKSQLAVTPIVEDLSHDLDNFDFVALHLLTVRGWHYIMASDIIHLI